MRQKKRILFPLDLCQVRRVRFLLVLCLGWSWAAMNALSQTSQPTRAMAEATTRSQLIEAAGVVEFTAGSSTNWHIATNGLALQPGDKVRTRAASRAAVQLSDRSVIRLSERTTLEILPPRRAEKKRFGLPSGSIYFFNREKPADVEFDTPLAAGAIRGTEFFLEVADLQAALHLALIDGQVALNTSEGEISLKRGEDLRLVSGQPPQKTALVNANAIIQWALYYPAVLNPADLELNSVEAAALAKVLEQYQSGDLLAALAGWPDSAPMTSPGVRALRAQLELAVGRVAGAEALLAEVPDDAAAKPALTELINIVRGTTPRFEARESRGLESWRSASELMAHSYALQQGANLEAARAAARMAVELAPRLGFARQRLAELESAFGQRRDALAELKQAYEFSPNLAPAHALEGFNQLEQGLPKLARVHFDKARELDAAFSPAWLGLGLCSMRERKYEEARAAFQAAAALEPQRGMFRAYLGKAASEQGDTRAAEKEFNLAKRLDPNDPTAWLYSALDLWQQNRLNEAIRDLEQSADLNDNRAVFRSRLLLDEDRSVRSANLAALYEEAGIPDASRNAAARAVSESYANFSGHLFLANSYQSVEDANGFDLRMETTRQSELLVANLLAPPGGGNLSQLLSQQEHLQFFDPRPVGVSSLTEYGSNGDWRESGTVFGTLGGFSYAFDAFYESLNGQQPNGESEQRQLTLTLKQRVTANDEAYFQIGNYQAEAGDVAQHYDPAQAVNGFHVEEKQEPSLYAGWHHAWSPGSHTLFLFARLDDQLSLTNPQPNVIFLRQTGGIITEVQSPPAGPPFSLDYASDFTLYSAELQQIWETPHHSLVLGGRWQSGDVDTSATLSRVLTGVVTDDEVNSSLERGNAYAYYGWQPLDALRLIGGVSYDYLSYPENNDLPPLTEETVSSDLVSPKAGLLLTPWERGLLRADYTKSLGGLYFDNSVRLEPTQVAGFSQAFRNLIPGSVTGLVPGTEFETAGLAFDQSLPSGTWFGVETQRLTSDGDRTVGVLTNSTFLPIPDSPGSTRQSLDFRERNLSAYAGQLLGRNFSLGVRYRLSDARLSESFPDIPDSAAGLAQLEGTEEALLQQLALAANFHHRSGLFAQWTSTWFHQNNSDLPDEDFWQHNLAAGYRFPRRRAELRLDLLNILDTDYRLNPLNLHAELPRDRTLAVSLRLNF